MNEDWLYSMLIYAACDDGAVIQLIDDFYLDEIIEYIQTTLGIENVTFHHSAVSCIPNIYVTYTGMHEYFIIQSWFNELDILRQK